MEPVLPTKNNGTSIEDKPAPNVSSTNKDRPILRNVKVESTRVLQIVVLNFHQAGNSYDYQKNDIVLDPDGKQKLVDYTDYQILYPSEN